MQGGVEEKAVRNSQQATAHMWEDHRKKGKLIQRRGQGNEAKMTNKKKEVALIRKEDEQKKK